MFSSLTKGLQTSEHQSHTLPTVLPKPCVGFDGKSYILFPLVSIDAQQDILIIPRRNTVFFGFLLPHINAGVDNPQVLLLRQLGPDPSHDALCKSRIDSDGVRKAHAPLLDRVEGHPIRPLQPRRSSLGQQKIGEMAIEQDPGIGIEEAQERQAGAELVRDECIGSELAEFGSEVYREDEMRLAKDGAYDGEPRQDGCGEQPVPTDAYIERT
jgi:hypothetical protein